MKKLIIALITAAALWFYMFSPWTQGRPNFWLVMSCSALILTALAITSKAPPRIEKPLLQIAAGIAIAFALWGVFWVGDKLSAMLFSFARPEVDAVYSMKQGLPSWAICLLLIALIGPAEEFFWRGYVQKSMSRLTSPNAGFIITAIIYALVHIWSFNFMLIMAALVAGLAWGLIYRIQPKALPALIVSHALWDALVFILLPI